MTHVSQLMHSVVLGPNQVLSQINPSYCSEGAGVAVCHVTHAAAPGDRSISSDFLMGLIRLAAIQFHHPASGWNQDGGLVK